MAALAPIAAAGPIIHADIPENDLNDAAEAENLAWIETDLQHIQLGRATRNERLVINSLAQLNNDLNRLDIRERQLCWQPRAASIVVELLREEGQSDEVRAKCFMVLGTTISMTPEEREDPDLMWIPDFCMNDLGGIQLAAKELLTDFDVKELIRQAEADAIRTSPFIRALLLLVSICLMPKYAERVCKSGVVGQLLMLGRDGAPNLAGVYALICLANLAIHPASHQTLLDAGTLPVSIGLLRFLNSSPTEFRSLDCGLSAAFLICRLVGKHEQGPGADGIHSNKILVEKLLWIFRCVLTAGPEGTVIGSKWDPANIVMDIATLTVADRNKPLLGRFIPYLLQGLRMYYKTNHRLSRYSVDALYQLYFDPACQTNLQANSAELQVYLEFIRSSRYASIETHQKATILLSRLGGESVGEI